MKKTSILLILIVSASNLKALSNAEEAREHCIAGCIAAEKGDYAGALSQFNAAIAQNPSDPVGWDRRGAIHFCMQNYGLAIADHNRAISIAPNNGFYYMERALDYFMIRDESSYQKDLMMAANLGEPNAVKIVTILAIGGKVSSEWLRKNL